MFVSACVFVGQIAFVSYDLNVALCMCTYTQAHIHTRFEYDLAVLESKYVHQMYKCAHMEASYSDSYLPSDHKKVDAVFRQRVRASLQQS